MKDLFVPYELALLAREKGFDEPCLRFYQNSEDLSENLDNQDINHFTNARAIRNETYSCLAPLYQQLIDWFRGKHKIHIEVFHQLRPANNVVYGIKIGSNTEGIQDGFDNYYEALKQSTGELEVIIIWEGGDSISSFKVKDGVIEETDIEL